MCSFLMGLEAGALGEALPAQRALVGLLPAVHHRVSDEVALFGEAPAALQAAERLLARVTPQVLLQLTEPHEAFVAVRAAELLLSEAGPPGSPHPPHEAKAAAALSEERSARRVGRRRPLAGVLRVLRPWLSSHRIDLSQCTLAFVWWWSLTSKRPGSSFQKRCAHHDWMGLPSCVTLGRRVFQSTLRLERGGEGLKLLPDIWETCLNGICSQVGRPQLSFLLPRHKLGLQIKRSCVLTWLLLPLVLHHHLCLILAPVQLLLLETSVQFCRGNQRSRIRRVLSCVGTF